MRHGLPGTSHGAFCTTHEKQRQMKVHEVRIVRSTISVSNIKTLFCVRLRRVRTYVLIARIPIELRGAYTLQIVDSILYCSPFSSRQIEFSHDSLVFSLLWHDFDPTVSIATVRNDFTRAFHGKQTHALELWVHYARYVLVPVVRLRIFAVWMALCLCHFRGPRVTTRTKENNNNKKISN